MSKILNHQISKCLALRRPLLNLEQDDAGQQEDPDPRRARQQPELNREPTLDPPAPAHDVPHGLAGAGAGQVPWYGLQGVRHALDGPEDPAEEEDRVEAADGELHGRRLGRANDGDEESWKENIWNRWNVSRLVFD